MYEFETWPNGGRRPTLSSLSMLARIYHTTGRSLLADDEFSVYGANAHAELDKVDFRHLDPNHRIASTFGRPDGTGARFCSAHHRRKLASVAHPCGRSAPELSRP